MIWLILEQWLEGKIDDDVNKEKFFFLPDDYSWKAGANIWTQSREKDLQHQ